MTEPTFNLDFPPHLLTLRDTVASFVANEILPVEQKLPPEARAIPAEQLSVLQGRARKLGLWCLDAPAEYGGAGLTSLEFVVAVEQASTFGWERYTGPSGARIGMMTFGASAPLKELLVKFGFTGDNVYAAAKAQLARKE